MKGLGESGEVILTRGQERFFAEEQALHEAKYLAGTNPRQQSGFGRDERDWERFRHPVVAPIETDGSFLDTGCYGSSRPEGARAELLVDELHGWGLPIDDAVSLEHGFVITRAVSVARSAFPIDS